MRQAGCWSVAQGRQGGHMGWTEAFYWLLQKGSRDIQLKVKGTHAGGRARVITTQLSTCHDPSSINQSQQKRCNNVIWQSVATQQNQTTLKKSSLHDSLNHHQHFYLELYEEVPQRHTATNILQNDLLYSRPKVRPNAKWIVGFQLNFKVAERAGVHFVRSQLQRLCWKYFAMKNYTYNNGTKNQENIKTLHAQS